MEKVNGSLQDIDIRKISHFIPIFLNAFMLIGRATTAKMLALTGCQRAGKYFQKLAKQQGFAKEWIQEVLDEARSSGYDHLVATLLDHTESPSEASGMEE